MRQYKKEILLLISLAMIAGLIFWPRMTPVVQAEEAQPFKITSSGVTVGSVTSETNSEGATIYSFDATLSVSGDKSSTGSLTIEVADDLAAVGSLIWNYNYTLSFGRGGDTKANISASAKDNVLGSTWSVFSDSVTNTTTWGSGNGSKEGNSNTPITVENWVAGSEITINFGATGDSVPFLGSTTSSAKITISNIQFIPATAVGVEFAPVSGIDYTVRYVDIDDNSTVKTPVVSGSATANELFTGISDAGFEISTTTGYYCAAVQVKAEDGTVTTKHPNNIGKFVAETGTIVTPVFVRDDDGIAPFAVGAAPNYSYYWTWESAFQAAAAGGHSTVILADDYTLPNTKEGNALTSDGTYVKFTGSGANLNVNYTLPNGITLLIPFDSAYTLYTDTPGHDSHAVWVQPTPYRKLTMASNTNIVVESNGAISLSARHHSGSPSENGGSPTGPVSFIDMQQDSSITIKNGANLYAWGYITGSGNVEILSGGTVYENFQMNDFRGGSHCYWVGLLGGKDYKVFPVNSYYVQNIEVPLKINAGASEICYATLYAADQNHSTPVPFISDLNGSAMFRISDGYAIKSYNGTTDRLTVDIHGTAALASMSLSLGGYSFDSSNYYLPLNSNITVNIQSGTTTVNQMMALLPGSEINVAENASVTLSKDVIVYDLSNWKAVYTNKTTMYSALAYAPGRTKTMTDTDLVDAKICINGILTATTGKLYSTSGGANIYSTGNGKAILTAGTTTQTYQITKLAYSSGGISVLYPNAGTTEAISITPAILQNGEYIVPKTVETSTAATYYYHPVHQIWYAGEHIEDTSKPGYCVCGVANYSFQYSNQIGWDTDSLSSNAWYLKSNLYVLLSNNYLDAEALGKLTVGAYFVKASDFGNAELTISNIRANENKYHIVATADDVISGNLGQYMVTAYFGKAVSTLGMDEDIYVLFYINDGKHTYYGDIRTRNVRNLAQDAIEQNVGAGNSSEVAMYNSILNYTVQVQANQSTFSSIPEMPSYMSATPSAGYFGLNTEAGIAIRQSASVVLIEPWGLRLNGYVSGTFDDYGLVLLNDRDRQFRYEMPTAQQLMAHPDAQVYAASDGSAAVNHGVSIGTGSFTQITTDYIGDLRTYELGNNLYVAFFVRDGENYRFGSVRKHNVYLLCRQALSMDLPETEKAVYLAMIDMFHKVSDYRK